MVVQTVITGTDKNFATGEITNADLINLKQQPEILGVEFSKLCNPALNVSDSKVWGYIGRQASGKTGAGVIIGIVDTGIDLLNPDFQDESGNTRIISLWDQTVSGSGPYDFGYGMEWNAAQIDAGSCTQTDNAGHGTHVVGIATGNGNNNITSASKSYIGMAPEADLIVVKTRFYTNDIINGIDYIARKAISEGKRWVVNLSLGTKWGPRNGNSNFESAINSLQNQVNNQGVITVSTHNYGFDANNPEVINNWNYYKFNKDHSRKSEPTSVSITVEGAVTNDDTLNLLLFYDPSSEYSIKINTPNNANILLNSGNWSSITLYDYLNTSPILPNTNFGTVFTQDGGVWIDNNSFNLFPLNTGENYIRIVLMDATSDLTGTTYHLANGDWTIEVASDYNGIWDLYIIKTLAYISNNNDYDNNYDITEPGNAPDVITVGSMNSKFSWIDIYGNNQPSYCSLFASNGYPLNEISFFSSLGPSRSVVEVLKPEIYAPGAWIASTMSSNSSIAYCYKEENQGGNYRYGQGTSMAAPHVAGAAALLLEQHPDWTSAQVKQRLLNRANTWEGYTFPMLHIHASLCVSDGDSCNSYPATPPNFIQNKSVKEKDNSLPVMLIIPIIIAFGLIVLKFSKKSTLFLLIFGSLLLLQGQSLENCDYLVFTPGSFLTGATWDDLLISHLGDRGFTAGIIGTYDTQTADDIQSMIQYYYNNGTQLKYVLFMGAGINLYNPQRNVSENTQSYPYILHGDINPQVNIPAGNFIPFHYELVHSIWDPAGVYVATDDYYIASLEDIFIGRIPTKSSNECDYFVNKLITYYNDLVNYSPLKSKEIYLAQDGTSNWNMTFAATVQRISNDVITNHIQPFFNVSLLQTSDHEQDASWWEYSPDRESLFETEINQGAGLISPLGSFGGPNSLVGWYWADQSGFVFTNTVLPFVLGTNCHQGETNHPIESAALQKMIVAETGGIIGFFAPSDNTEQEMNGRFQKIFHNELLAQNNSISGKLFQDLKSLLRIEYGDKFEFYTTSLINYSEPAMPIGAFQKFDNFTLTSDMTLSGSVLINNFLVVPSGITLEVKPGTGLFFNPGAKLRVYGTLIAEGTSDFPIKFSSVSETPSAGDWYGIRFENSSVDDDCIIKYANIEYATYGALLYRSSPKIENCRFENNILALYPYYSNSAINSNMITNNTYGSGAIYMYRSSPTLLSNTIADNGNVGIYCLYSSPKFGPTSGSGKGFNVIRNNSSDGIHAYYYSFPFLGSSTSENTRIGGYNSIYDNSSYYVSATSNSNVEAEYNWWGSSPPPSSKFYSDGTSSIDKTPYLTSNPGGGSPLSRTTNDGAFEFVSDITSNRTAVTGDGGFDPYVPDTNSVGGLWMWANDLWLTENPREAIHALKILIRRFSKAPEAPRALVLLVSLYQETESGGLSGYLNSLTNRPGISEQIKTITSDLLIGTYVNEGRLNQAKNTANRIIRRNPDSESEYLALFELFSIYYNELEDVAQAQATLDILIDKYPDYELTLMAQFEMGQDVDWSNSRMFDQQAGAEKMVSADLETLPEEYRLGDNYPNPFNPTTVIPYELPEDSRVSLVIYDVLGREIIRLVEGDLSAGYRQVVWDGKDHFGKAVSSGVYIYRIYAKGINRSESSGQTAEYSHSQKMLLIR